MDEKVKNEVVKIIKMYNSFSLFCHISPDGDALGSMNALKLVLQKMGKKAYAYCDGKIPSDLSFLNISLETDAKFISKSDVCIMVDCNSLDRIGVYGDDFDKAKIKIDIDHHQKSNYVFDFSLVDEKSPSSADILYELIKHFDVILNSQIAQNLYVGLSTDTGCFMHPSTNGDSHRHAYELLNYNFDLSSTNYSLFKYKQKNYLYFYKTALKNTRAYLSGKVYVTFFDYRAYKRFENVLENTNCFQFLDGIEENEIRVKIIEKEVGVFSLSFRSNKFANVCNIAKTFGGGGHIRASGATTSGNYKEMLGKILEACKLELEESKS